MTREICIRTRLQKTLTPLFLDVQNESGNHHVPEGSETHFKVVIISEKFENMPRIARHRLVYDILGEELKTGLHALSLHLYSPDEQKSSTPASPACRDGFNK